VWVGCAAARFLVTIAALRITGILDVERAKSPGGLLAVLVVGGLFSLGLCVAMLTDACPTFPDSKRLSVVFCAGLFGYSRFSLG
jgi:hypothetical protein